MTDPRALLEAYAEETDFYRGDLLDDREHEAPKAFAALRAVLDLHAPEHDVLPECSHCYAEGDVDHVPWPCDTVKAITAALGVDDA